MKRRAFLAAAAAPLVAAAVPRPTRAARSGGGVGGARHRRPRVAPRRGRRRLGSRPEADPDGARARAAWRRAASGRRSSPTRRTAGSASSTPRGLTVVAEIGGLGEPRYTAMHPSEPLAYVSDSRRQSVVVVDLARRRVVGHVAVPGPARHLSSARTAGALWVALGEQGGARSRSSTPPTRGARSSRRTVAPPFLAHDVVWAPGGEQVWVTSGSRRPGRDLRARTREAGRAAAGRRAAAAHRVHAQPGLRDERRRRHRRRPPPRRHGRPHDARSRRLVQRRR